MEQEQILQVEVEKVNTISNGRKRMDPDGLAALAATIKAHGILEPLLIMANGDNGAYRVIAGHRRLAAAKLAGLTHVPCILKAVDAQTGAEMQLVENLQREDLDEVDEAGAIADLVKMKGPEGIPEIAERTGKSPFYVRRRWRAATMPAKVLQLWKAGTITYSHVEQLLRVPEALLKDVLKSVLEPSYYQGGGAKVMTAERLRDYIDRMNVTLDVWPIKGSECETCQSNTAVQENLFGFTMEAKGKKVAHCLNPGCFMSRAGSFYAENWAKTKVAKVTGTSAPVFLTRKDVSLINQNYGYIEKPKGECKVCDHFVTLICTEDMIVAADRACKDPACYKKVYDKKKGGAKLDGKTGKVEAVDEKAVAEARYRQRCYNHGWEQREEVYKKYLPGTTPTEQAGRVALAALLYHDCEGQRIYMRDAMGEAENDTRFPDMGRILQHVWTRTAPEVLAWCKTLSVRTVLLPEFGKENRHIVYSGCGRKLTEDYKLNKEFLEKKTKDELIQMGEFLGLLERGTWTDQSKKIAIEAEILAVYGTRKAKPGLNPDPLVPPEVLDPNQYKEVKK